MADAVAIIVAAVLVVHVLYAMWTARRLDRLHRRRDAAGHALDQQLRQRAVVAAAFAGRHPRAAGADALRRAADAALAARGMGPEREAVENALARALLPFAAQADEPLVDAVTRAAFARRFHNDTVRDALTVRQRRIVRWCRLAGHAPLPTYFEIDDNALAGRRTIAV